MTSQINGLLVDDQSRCQHYHSPLDIVALKCFECQKYYACYQCHDRLEAHIYRAYPCQLKQDKVLICGVCRHEMTIEEYQDVEASTQLVQSTMIFILKNKKIEDSVHMNKVFNLF